MTEAGCFDFIGDIHGHADQLESLLKKMNYRKDEVSGIYFHPRGRRAFFVGDFIDRGPRIKETLELVKGMADSGNALAVIGNHEYNALCFWNKHEGEFLREHNTKNIHQHYRTIECFRGKDNELFSFLEWFRTLPLFYEHETFRVIHANWDHRQVEVARKHGMTDCNDGNLLVKSVCDPVLKDAVEILLKGNEVKHPVSFTDKDGHQRFEYRVKWWRNGKEELPSDYLFEFPDPGVSERIAALHTPYFEHERPVFFGHYWLRAERPGLMAPNICCLDYSVAKQGMLVAYRWNGEQVLSEENFVWV